MADSNTVNNGSNTASRKSLRLRNPSSKVVAMQKEEDEKAADLLLTQTIKTKATSTITAEQQQQQQQAAVRQSKRLKDRTEVMMVDNTKNVHVVDNNKQSRTRALQSGEGRGEEQQQLLSNNTTHAVTTDHRKRKPPRPNNKSTFPKKKSKKASSSSKQLTVMGTNAPRPPRTIIIGKYHSFWR